MRVLQINSVCGYGSTGNIVVDLYHELEKQGHECCAAYGRGTAPGDVRTYRIGSDLDVYVHGILSRITDKHALYSKRATRKFVEWMKQYDPDVIHLHNLHGYYINIEILFYALKELNKPVVWTLHDCWAYTGHCAHYSMVKCGKWISGCSYCPQKKQYPTSVICDNSKENYSKKRQIFNCLDKLTIVTPSNWLAEEVKKSFLAKYSQEVIYNGIDLDVFSPTESDFRQKYHLENKKIILGVANVWNDRKGLEVFEQLVNELDKSYKVVLIGVNSRQRANINPKILCIDRTSDQRELACIYTAADIYINPSVEETMGLTTVEALACGTDVLVRNSTALPEIVEFDSDKILLENQWNKSVMEALNKETTPIQNCEMAKKYEKSKQYKKYISLYQKILYGE